MDNRLIALPLLALAATAAAQQTDSVATRSLNEVVINGERPHVKGENGIMVVDLPALVSDKPVSNILEALGYLPGVVNNNGMIGLAGASGVTILLNGEQTNMPVENLYQLLYTTPVDRLHNVEVMYTAPARYHADGAVINIVLKTPRPLDGLQGQIRAGYNLQHYSSYGGAVAATYAANDWTFDVNYGVSRTKGWKREETFSNHLHNGRREMITDNMRRISENLTNTIYAATTFKRLKLTYNGQITSMAKGWSLSEGTMGDFTNAHTCDDPVNYHNVALRYNAPFGLTTGGDYTYYGEHRRQSLTSGEAFLSGSINRQDINRIHVYADMQHQLGKWQFGYGVEYARTDDSSSQVNYPDSDTGFAGNSAENVADAYVSLQRSFEWGLSFNVSAKAEYFSNDLRRNWNFIPQAGATYYRTPTSIFQLNFATRRIYPAYWELHNRTSYISPYAKVAGNPALQPYLDYAGQLSYILKQKYVATLYVQYGHRATVQLPYQSPDELSLIYQTINTDYKRSIGLNLNVPFNAGRIWSATATINVFNQREKASAFHAISFDNRKWVVYGSLSNSLSPGNDFPVALTVDVTYISPSVQGIADLSAMWKIDAGLKWQFGRKRCCELNLKADDIFNTFSPTMSIDSHGQDFRMKVRDMTRNLKLTLIWRFNGFRPAENTAPDTSRFGTSD